MSGGQQQRVAFARAIAVRPGCILFDEPLSALDARRQAAEIGFVLQKPDDQIVTDRVWHELAFGLESLGCDKDSMRFRVAEMASYFGIESWFHKDVRDLSGGQKQLLNLASIMAMRPSVLILDEPTSQLDPIAASNFLNTVRKINLELGVTVVLTEHRLEEVFACADKVVVMDWGAIASVGSPREVALSLHASGNDMMAALPAPLRIFYGVQTAREAGLEKTCPAKAPAQLNAEGKTAVSAGEDCAVENNAAVEEGNSDEHSRDGADAFAAPLTVREGRRWLPTERRMRMRFPQTPRSMRWSTRPSRSKRCGFATIATFPTCCAARRSTSHLGRFSPSWEETARASRPCCAWPAGSRSPIAAPCAYSAGS